MGVSQQALCSNAGGIDGILAGIAVATGKEVRRWKPETDFQWNATSGMLELTATGRARCTNQVCGNTQALLDLQKPAADNVVPLPGNITLDADLLRSRLKSNWEAQTLCLSQGRCAAEAHDLKFAYSHDAICGKAFVFDAIKEKSFLPVFDLWGLTNKLMFLGYPGNEIMAFWAMFGQVSVDPTYGLNTTETTTTGSCEAVCTKFSATDVSGKCCTCNGSTKKLARSAFSPSLYLCQ